jgi:hypothetical protein
MVAVAASAVAAPAATGNVEFIRARSDKREYRRLVLPNALECLLIRDAETDKVRPFPSRPRSLVSAPASRKQRMLAAG